MEKGKESGRCKRVAELASYKSRSFPDFVTGGFSSADRLIKDDLRTGFVCPLDRMNQRIKPRKESSIAISNIEPPGRLGHWLGV